MGNQNPIMDIFNEITYGIKIINCDVYNLDGLEFIYYNKNGEWIFYQDIKNKRFWGEYNRYWSIFQKKFNLRYEEIQEITKLLLEEVLKRELDTPNTYKLDSRRKVEDALKRELDKNFKPITSKSYKVEEVLKRELEVNNSLDIKKTNQVLA